MKKNKMKKVYNVRTHKMDLIKVEGYDVVNHKYLPEIKLFLHKYLDKLPVGDNKQITIWAISELESGLTFVYGTTRKQAIENLNEMLYDKNEILTFIKDIVNIYGEANK